MVESQRRQDPAKAQHLQDLFRLVTLFLARLFVYKLLMLYFSDLTRNVQPTVEGPNREKFTSALSSFRVDVKTFLDLNAFYKALVHFTNE